MSETTINGKGGSEAGLGGGIEPRPAPVATSGFVGWMRANLFSSPLNSFGTIVSILFIAWIVPGILDWAFFDAHFVGTSKDDCRVANEAGLMVIDGACWVLVYVRWEQLIYGFYGSEGSLWRPTITFFLLFVAVAPLLFDNMPFRKPLLWFAAAYPIIAIWLLAGGFLGLPEVDTHKWGGLMLTLVIGVVGITLSLPIGIVLALGRRSQMPAVRLLCVIFIEFLRGVPLITLLFMASNMLPLFFPEGVDLDKLVRALVVVVAFSAAYMAEVVRGGLQAIPKGQYEAADAMGLSYWKSMYLIILPQALKIVIPGIVNSFIGLFKDTTLVLIIGLFDILGMAKAAVTHANWIGLAREAYVFVGVVYFIFCFGMSRYSIWLEGKLDTGHKR